MRDVIRHLIVAGGVLAVAACGLGGDSTGGGAATVRVAIPRAECQPGDKVETGLQGQVPPSDRQSGRAAQGYNCNLDLVGSFKSNAWATLDTMKDCAYYGETSVDKGTIALDVSDPAHPVQTDYLTTPAMMNPWEALRVNAARGLLVTDHDASQALDIYDVSGDCRHPAPLFAATMPTAEGHEGWFQPDGMVYYMTAYIDALAGTRAAVFPIDLSDPTQPKELAAWTFPGTIHGGSISDDGTRGYFCEFYPGDSIYIIDTTEVQNRKPNAQFTIISNKNILPDTMACQATYPVTYGGKPYVIQFGELATSRGCAGAGAGYANFSVPHIIDVSDEQNPKLASTLMLEVDDPANCAAVQPDTVNPNGSPQVFTYDVHHCSPDRLHDPTILACGQFLAGLRVYDIRDPYHPKELAYYNLAQLGEAQATGAVSRPIVRTDLRQIWFTDEATGFHVAQFAEGVWPFPETPKCPPVHDYYFNQYNPGLGCN